MRVGARHKVREQRRKERHISSIPFICSHSQACRNRLLRWLHKNVLKFDFVLVLSDITYRVSRLDQLTLTVRLVVTLRNYNSSSRYLKLISPSGHVVLANWIAGPWEQVDILCHYERGFA